MGFDFKTFQNTNVCLLTNSYLNVSCLGGNQRLHGIQYWPVTYNGNSSTELHKHLLSKSCYVQSKHVINIAFPSVCKLNIQTYCLSVYIQSIVFYLCNDKCFPQNDLLPSSLSGWDTSLSICRKNAHS